MSKDTTNTQGWKVYKRLLSYSAHYWYFFLLSIIGFAVYSITQALLVYLLKFFVDGIGNPSATLLTIIPAAVIGLSFARGLGSFFGNYFMSRISLHIVNDLRKLMFDHMLKLPSKFHDKSNSGELVSMITYNVNQVTVAASEAVKVLFREGFTVIALMGYLLWQNWILTLVFLLITPLLAGLVMYTSKYFRRMSTKMQASMGQVTHISNETIQGYQLVRSYGGEKYEQERFHQASDTNTLEGIKFSKVAAIQAPLFAFLLSIAIALLMFLLLYIATDSTVGDLVSYISAAGLLAKPVKQLSAVNSNLQRGIAAADSIFDLLDEPAEKNSGSKEINPVLGRIEFNQVSFSYEAGKQVLHDINLLIEPGETVALVGRSGSGKSTLVSLLLRFYEVSKGSVSLDHVDICELNINSLRQQIALVNQQVVLFNDTVAGNIAYGQLAHASADSIKKAAQDANALEFIEALPEGMNTIIGEDGTLLSGGQRQRLSIARAILKNAPILILDEATSSLDTESEHNIQEALDTLMSGRTTLVIAHRLSTIEKANRIIVMDKGKIVEQGTHKELLAKSGHYAKLHAMQFSE